jgi:hypothetical protein
MSNNATASEHPTSNSTHGSAIAQRATNPVPRQCGATKQFVLAGRHQRPPSAALRSQANAFAICGQRAGLLELFLGHLAPPACSAEGMARPPVIPVYVLMARVADWRGNPASRAQTTNRSVD